MNSFERIMNTLQQKEVDRVPVLAVLGAYASRLINQPIQKIYQDPELYLKAQKAITDTFAIDAVFAPFDYSIFAEAFNSHIKYFEDQVPNITHFTLQKAEDFSQLIFPDFEQSARLPYYFKSVQLLHQTFNNQAPIFSVLPGPLSFPILLMGLDEWMNTLLFNQTLAYKILENLKEFYQSLCRKLVQLGSTALIITEAFLSSEIAHRQLIDQFFPVIVDYFKDLNTFLVMHSTGARYQQNLELVLQLPHLLGIALSSKDSISETRKVVGNQLLIIGNLDNMTFPLVSDKEIYRQSLKCIESNNDQGPFILSNSGADIALNTPETNIHAMIKAAFDYQGMKGGLNV